jgi:2-polyprenyl-3-methyl-5-hydroxy-6-metoxy-1,4-benzoquinol methylase
MKRLIDLLLRLDNLLYWLISRSAISAEGGEHPKHRLTKYYDFFCERVRDGEDVLDLGCGDGRLVERLARCTHGLVMGVDRSIPELVAAQQRMHAQNAVFVCSNIERLPFARRFDVVVLSNVLEHLTARVDFLTTLVRTIMPLRVLVRVPMFDREWLVPYKRERGIEWRLDNSHSIEYTMNAFVAEMTCVGLRVMEASIKWGELYAVVTRQIEP